MRAAPGLRPGDRGERDGGGGPRGSRTRLARAVGAAAFALGVLALVLPVQGVKDRLGAAGDRPPASGAADYDAAVVDLLQRGAWWRVEPDYSYFLVMHDRTVAGDRGLPFLVSTYGPWGFVTRGCTPGTYLPVLAAWLFLGAGLAAAATLAVRRTEVPPGPRVLWGAAFLVGLAALPRDLTLLLLPASLSAGDDGEDSGGRRAARAVACAGAGLAALVKHNALAVALVALSVLVVRRLLAGRRPGPEPLVFAASLGAFWVGAGGSLGDVPAYLASAAAVVASYTESASTAAGPGDAGALPAAALLAALLAAEALAARRRRRGAGVVDLLGTAAIGLAVFKSGAVRSGNPEHLELAVAGLALLALLRLPYWAEALGGERRGAQVLGLGAGAAAAVLVPLFPPGEVARQLSALARPAEARRASDARCAADLRAIRDRNPLPPIAGSVDLFENRQSLLLAHGLDYRPRPVFQSYLATGGLLARRNAEHVAGPGAAERVLFEAWSIDRRLPALDDSLAWLELLRRYDVEAVSGPLALLRLRDRPRRLGLVPAGSVESGFGEAAPVPLAGGAAIWVTVDLRPTLLGRLAGLVYKLPELEVRLGLADGRQERWRFVRPAGRTGFLLSPTVEGALDMALLVSGAGRSLEPKGVRSVSVGLARGEGTSILYGERVDYRFERVVVTPADPAAAGPP